MRLCSTQFGHAVAALLLTLLAIANADEDTDFSPFFPTPHRPEIIPCLPRKNCGVVLCKRVYPKDCPSGRTIRCGCCIVCLVELGYGEQCRFFVPNNARCGPGLQCGSSGQCEYRPDYLPGVLTPGYTHQSHYHPLPHPHPHPHPPHCHPLPPPPPPPRRRCHRHPPPQKCTCRF